LRFLGGLLIGVGALALIAIVAFVVIALGFRQSFTSSLPPVEDLAMGLGVLGGIAAAAVALMWWGWRLLQRA
jgi:hypothetical protein